MEPITLSSKVRVPEAGGGLADQFLTFGVQGRLLAIAVAQLERVVQAAEITPVPGSPVGIAGGLNVAGEIVPVLDARSLLSPEVSGDSQPQLDDHFLLMHLGEQLVALWVHQVYGLVTAPLIELRWKEDEAPWQGLQTSEGLVLVCDLHRLLNLELAMTWQDVNLPVPDTALALEN